MIQATEFNFYWWFKQHWSRHLRNQLCNQSKTLFWVWHNCSCCPCRHKCWLQSKRFTHLHFYGSDPEWYQDLQEAINPQVTRLAAGLISSCFAVSRHFALFLYNKTRSNDPPKSRNSPGLHGQDCKWGMNSSRDPSMQGLQYLQQVLLQFKSNAQQELLKTSAKIHSNLKSFQVVKNPFTWS